MSTEPPLSAEAPANVTTLPNSQVNWVEIRVKVSPEWRDFFQEQATAHGCSLSDEIRYTLGHHRHQILNR